MPIEPWWETNPATTPRQELGMVSPELAAEEVHLADRSVQHMVHLPAECFSRCSWHG